MMAAQVALRRQQAQDESMRTQFGVNWGNGDGLFSPGYSTQPLPVCSQTFRDDKAPERGQIFDCKYVFFILDSFIMKF